MARARRWAAAVAPDRAYEATSLDAARAALHAHGHAGPVVLAAPDVPGLDAALARDVLDDLADGATITLGATHDATPYVLGLPDVDDELLGLAGRGLEEIMRAVGERDGVLGMVRSERRLSSPADARALALDPMTPPDLARELAPLARRLRHDAEGR